MMPAPTRCADEPTLDDLFEWAADQPLTEDGEHLFRVIGQLVYDLRADCEDVLS